MGKVVIPDHLARLSFGASHSTTFHAFVGDVVDAKVWSETNVHGSTQPGGAGYVSSSTRENREFFLKDDEVEKSFRMANVNFPVRDGNKVCIVWQVPKGMESGPHVYLRNYATKYRCGVSHNW